MVRNERFNHVNTLLFSHDLDLMSLPDNIRYCKQLTSVDCSSNRLERLVEYFSF
jgi:Leucine-rich repeat (LRR) protein